MAKLFHWLLAGIDAIGEMLTSIYRPEDYHDDRE